MAVGESFVLAVLTEEATADLVATFEVVATCFVLATGADLVAFVFPVFTAVFFSAFFTFVFLAVFRVATFFVANVHSP